MPLSVAAREIFQAFFQRIDGLHREHHCVEYKHFKSWFAAFMLCSCIFNLSMFSPFHSYSVCPFLSSDLRLFTGLFSPILYSWWFVFICRSQYISKPSNLPNLTDLRYMPKLGYTTKRTALLNFRLSNLSVQLL